MRINCCSCARQVIPGSNASDDYIAPGINPKAAFRYDEVFCDECAEDLDPNGLLPGEAHYKPEDAANYIERVDIP